MIISLLVIVWLDMPSCASTLKRKLLDRPMQPLRCSRRISEGKIEPGIICSRAPLKIVKRRAVLLFADCLGLDLARRRLPQILRPLLDISNLAGTPDGPDVHVFSSVYTHGSAHTVHLQRGRSFAEKLENAVEAVVSLGYEEIVIIGRDCPQLNSADIATAFDALAERRLVLGPDHRGGCYLIALRSAERELLRGIRWRRNTDCAQLRGRCAEGDVLLLTTKHDVDSWADVEALARNGSEALARCAGFLLRVISAAPATSTRLFVDLARQFERVRGQMPPPVLVG